MSLIVTAGISFTATLWQRDRPLLTSLPPTILHPSSALMPYGSSLTPARTSLGVNACKQSYPKSNPTLQSNRSCISCFRRSQVFPVLGYSLSRDQLFFIGGDRPTCKSDLDMNFDVRIISSTWRLETLWLSMSASWLVMVLSRSFVGWVSASSSSQFSLRKPILLYGVSIVKTAKRRQWRRLAMYMM